MFIKHYTKAGLPKYESEKFLVYWIKLTMELSIGTNVIIGAGSVVTKDIPDNCLVVGVPAIIKKELPKLIF